MSLRLSNESFAAQSVSNWVPNTWSCGSRCPTDPLLALTPWTFGSRMPKRPTQRLLWAKIHTLRYQLQVPRDGGAKSNSNNPELFHHDLRMEALNEDVSSEYVSAQQHLVQILLYTWGITCLVRRQSWSCPADVTCSPDTPGV